MAGTRIAVPSERLTRGFGIDLKVDDDDLEQQIRIEIVDLIRTSPRLADTLVGISKCWVPKLANRMTLERMDILLNKLVEEGILVSHSLPDGRALYSCPGISAIRHSDSDVLPKLDNDVSSHKRDE